jgi:hypothetical protein
MKTAMQELIEIIKKRQEDDEAMPFMYNDKIIALAESLLEKEKETEMLRASLIKKVSELNDNEIISLYDELSEFFNTEEK